MKTFLSILCLLTLSLAAAEKIPLNFSAQPSSGDSFLCNFLFRQDTECTMKMRGQQQPRRRDVSEQTITGTLSVIVPGTSYEFAVSRFAIVKNGVPGSVPPAISGKTVRIQKDDSGEYVFSFAAEMHSLPFPSNPLTGQIQPEEVPDSLKQILHQLLALTMNDNTAIFGKNGSRSPGEVWQVNPELPKMLAEQRGLDSGRIKWDSKITFAGLNIFQGIPSAVLRLELLSKPFPGYDCKIDSVYRFSVKTPNIPLAVNMEWSEVADRVMPDSNPVFSGTHFTEVKHLTVSASFIPLTLPE